MQKHYHSELVEGRIYFGGAGDIQQVTDDEKIDMVVDLREGVHRLRTGIQHRPDVEADSAPGDGADQPQAELFKDAIQSVVSAAYRQGRKVAFHCGGGKGRTGTVAAGILLELGLCSTLAEASQGEGYSPVVNIKPDQRKALEHLYPTA